MEETEFDSQEHAEIVMMNLGLYFLKKKNTVFLFLYFILNRYTSLQSVVLSDANGTTIYENREHQICVSFLFYLVSVQIYILVDTGDW